MGSLRDRKWDGMFVYYHLEDEVRRCSRLDCGPQDPIMMGVNKCLIQIQCQDLPLRLA